jgi:glutamate 5-kinase
LVISPRSELRSARRVVVKIGSAALSQDANLPAQIAVQVAQVRAEQRLVLIVSSGAIALGCERLGYRERPKDTGQLQAAAAAGQSVLLHRYETALGSVGLIAAQVLLTHADLADRVRVNNARRALAALLDAGVVPIINENDTVATDELRFGDNDQLASMVAPLVSADVLVFLSSVEGVLDAAGKRISVMPPDAQVAAQAGPKQSLGSGGIQSKVDAARKVQLSGASAIVASAHDPTILIKVLDGQDVGTFFQRLGEPLRARKHWIAYTLRPRGTVIVDAGAVDALRHKHRSLLPVGVIGVRGDFHPGDSVCLVGLDGSEVGRGLTRLGAVEVARAAGKRATELESLFGTDRDVIVVHRDDLVVHPSPPTSR